jgi:hypothetical protein
LSFLGILFWFVLSVFLNKDNIFLSTLNKNNLYKEHLKLKTEEIKLNKELIKKNKKIGELKGKIDNSDFSERKDEIKYIETEKLHWLHEKLENGFSYGIYDGVYSVRDFFNHPELFVKSANSLPLENKILFGRSVIRISNFNGNEKELRFNVEISQSFDKVFFLAAKFAEVLNEFPLYKDVEIKSFSRQKLSTGETVMTFPLSIKLQKKGEKDLKDKGRSYQLVNNYLEKKYQENE